MSQDVTIVSDLNFEKEVINSDIPALVDFWAPWCGPCLSIAPTIEAIAKEQRGVVKVCKLNVDDNPETAARYSIRGIPTIIIFKNGQVVNQITGAVSKSEIEAMLDN